MFIERIWASDERFKALTFHAGLNILVADRTESSDQGDSRNGTGKSSLIRIMRYLLAGSLPEEFRSPLLAEHRFSAALQLPSSTGEGNDAVSVTRAISPSTRVEVVGWSATEGQTQLHVDEWRDLLATWAFQIPDNVTRPTPGQLWGQLIRTYFGNPTKSHQSESDWETGVKLGFLLGLAPEVLGKAGDVDSLIKQRKAIRRAVKEGALAHLSFDEAGLRAQLATARRQRDKVQEDLRNFHVDEQYADHQRTADRISAAIQRLNDEGVRLTRRQRELTDALALEASENETADLIARLTRIYAEAQLILPDRVARRFDEVEEFHRSVVENRRSFLEDEMATVTERLTSIAAERAALDGQRAEVMTLLRDSVALDTFLDAQRSLAELESTAADLERRLKSATSVNEIDDTIKLRTADAVASVRGELRERESSLDGPISMYSELGEEIYTDKEVSLLVSPTSRGLLDIKPRVSGDASDGIRSVETFLLDLVCVIAASSNGRSPGILAHDSHLFDSVDGRQVASCLNIGARMAELYNFQYVVTINSDFLQSVAKQSDEAFDPAPYVLPITLTDASDGGGLFGFRFE